MVRKFGETVLGAEIVAYSCRASQLDTYTRRTYHAKLVLCYYDRVGSLHGDAMAAALAGVLVLHEQHPSDGKDIGVCGAKPAKSKAAPVGTVLLYLWRESLVAYIMSTQPDTGLYYNLCA